MFSQKRRMLKFALLNSVTEDREWQTLHMGVFKQICAVNMTPTYRHEQVDSS